jgi:hypothetical protein
MWYSMVTNHDFGQMVAFCALMVTIVAWHAITAWRKHLAVKAELELKMEMVSRGMTAQDIERVLAARLSGDPAAAENEHRQ